MNSAAWIDSFKTGRRCGPCRSLCRSAERHHRGTLSAALRVEVTSGCRHKWSSMEQAYAPRKSMVGSVGRGWSSCHLSQRKRHEAAPFSGQGGFLRNLTMIILCGAQARECSAAYNMTRRIAMQAAVRDPGEKHRSVGKGTQRQRSLAHLGWAAQNRWARLSVPGLR